MDSNNHPNSQSQSQPYYSLNNFPYHRFSPNANISFSQIPSFSAQTSSPPVEAASQPEKTPRERRIWTSSDDLVLISGWLYTSKDVIIGNDQRAGAFWKRIGDYYASSTHVLGGAEPRLPDHCRQRWQKIQKMVARFCGFYAEAFSEKASGMNDLDIINNAHQLYYKLYKKKFSLEYAWNALRYEPKWLNLEPMNPTPKTTSSNKRKADGAPGTSNDLNVLAQSPVFNDIIYGRAPQMNYYVNGREYNLSYYLTDGIYPEWATFVKSIQRPQHPKHRLFAEHQEGARKDVERAFGVLQSRFAMIKNPCRFLSKGKIAYIMRACLILHNMIVEDERYSYTLYDKEEFEQDEIHTFSVEMPTNLEGLGDGHTRIRDRQAHHQLKEDLIENIWTTFGNE